MEQLSARILERSSDAIVIIRLADRTVLAVNEAFFAVTGHPQHEIEGRHVPDLLVPLEWSRAPKTVDALGELGALVDAPIGLWTRAGELRRGDLSALVVDAAGQREAVCVIRDVRDPTPDERRLAARARFTHTIEAGGPRLEVATRAIQALGESLRWEFGALWLSTAETQSLRCVAVWRSRLADLEPLEDASWRTAAAFGVGLVGRCWRDRQAAWAADATVAPEPEPRQQIENVGGLVHGWFGFPVWTGGDVIGVVEFFSREVRQPDEALLQMTDEFAKLLGHFLEDAEVPWEPSNRTLTSGVDTRGGRAEEPAESVSSAQRSLEQAAATVAGSMERQPDVRTTQGSPQADSPEVPTGLTLKAVSTRTGIPAATLRTWERRYGFLRPMRSANGYRLYGEQEIARVLEVKKLLQQGLRIGTAMEVIRGTSRRPQAAG